MEQEWSRALARGPQLIFMKEMASLDPELPGPSEKLRDAPSPWALMPADGWHRHLHPSLSPRCSVVTVTHHSLHPTPSQRKAFSSPR